MDRHDFKCVCVCVFQTHNLTVVNVIYHCTPLHNNCVDDAHLNLQLWLTDTGFSRIKCYTEKQ